MPGIVRILLGLVSWTSDTSQLA